MSIDKPYYRNYRPCVDGPNAGYNSCAYIEDPEYSKAPRNYIRSFMLLQDDIKHLFEYIEPADINLNTYSYRIHELFIRACIEIEANFKAILRENSYTKSESRWNISDYKLINRTHHLDAYQIGFPIWDGDHRWIIPFNEWRENNSLSWYSAYNQCKHNRHDKRQLANLKNLLYAYTALFALLSSQFYTESFEPGLISVGYAPENCEETGIGDYLIINFPNNWTDEEKYNFDWTVLKEERNRFHKINYDELI